MCHAVTHDNANFPSRMNLHRNMKFYGPEIDGPLHKSGIRFAQAVHATLSTWVKSLARGYRHLENTMQRVACPTFSRNFLLRGKSA